MRKNVRSLLLLCLIFATPLLFVACNKSTDQVDSNGNPLASIEENGRSATPVELQFYTSPEFLADPDGDGSIATNAFWLNAKASPFVSLPIPSVRASVGTGKKILFYTRLNNQWLNFTSDLRQLLADNGYTVVVHNQDTLLPDLTDVDVLAIVHSIGTPITTPNDRPMPPSDKQKIRDFVASGKGFFFSGDWLNSELPKFNDIAGIFNVTMSLWQIDYILTGYPPPTIIFIPTWNAYVMDWVNYYGPNPSQPIMRKTPVFTWMSFSNETHEIFKDVNSVLFLGSSHVRPRVPALAAIRTHPTTSIPRDYPIVPQGYPIAFINEYSAGRYAMSCDTNAFGNDGFATSDLAHTDNRTFALNIFNWLAKASIIEGALKILNPQNNDVFDFGQTINFIGSQTGNITNIEWVSSIDGVFAVDTLFVTKSNLSPGTHTITLRGIIGAPPASIRAGPLAQIRAANVGDPVSASITIVVKERNPDVRVISIDWLSMSGKENRNRLFDRGREVKTAGDKFLEPTQWGATISGNDVLDDFIYPVSYVRSEANFLSGAQSNFRLKVKATDLLSTPTPTTIEIGAHGRLFDGTTFVQDIAFATVTANISNWPQADIEIESSTPLPNMVGIWNLEITWSFVKNGQLLNQQRTPKSGNYFKLFTTWEKPIVNGYFFQDEESKPGGPMKVEEIPTYYLEFASFSCEFSKNANSSNSKTDVLTKLFNNAWNLGSQGYKYDAQTAAIPGVTPRGLDSLLIWKTGWCEEWSTFFKALAESQGIDIWYRGIKLTPEQIDILKHRLYLTNRDLPALGGDIQNPEPRWWSFRDHAYNSTDLFNVYDLSFNGVSPSEETYTNNSFDLVIYPTREIYNPDPFPSDIHILLAYD